MKDIKKYIVAYVERKGKVSADVDLDTFDFIKSGHIDSIAMFKFVVDIEMEFEVEMTDEDIMSSQFMTIGGLTSIISEKIAAKS